MRSEERKWGNEASPVAQQQCGAACRRTWRVVTAGNLIALGMLLAALLFVLSTTVPYRIVNSSYVCKHCGEYQYNSQRFYAGVRILNESVLVETEGSRLYQQIMARRHEHEWLLSGACRGVGNLFEQGDFVIIKGSGAARAKQVEQSLIALSDGAALWE